METWQGGGIPFGYKYNHEKDLLEVDKAESDTLKKVFELAKSGSGDYKITSFLNENKLSSRYTNMWDQVRVGYLLSPSRLQFYTGYHPDGEKGDWKPLLTKAAYSKILELRNNPRDTSSDKKNDSYLLTGIGIAKCGYCGATIKTNSNSKPSGKVSYYACALRQRSGKSVCPDSAMLRQELVNDMVLVDIKISVKRSDLFEKYPAFLKSKLAEGIKSLQSSKMDIEKIKESLEKQLDTINTLTTLSKPSYYCSAEDLESKQRTVTENLNSILLFSDRIELNYKYPINEKFELTKVLWVKK